MVPHQSALRLCGAALLLGSVLSACGGDDPKPSATPSPGSTASTVVPTAVPATSTPAPPPGSVGVQRIPVRWVPESTPFDIAGAPNPDAPFDGRAQEIQGRSREAGPDLWRVHVVEGGAAPRLLHTSRKSLGALRWGSAGIDAHLLTERPVTSSVLGIAKAFRWQGTLTLNPATGSATERLNAFPDAIGTVVEGSPIAISLQSFASGETMFVEFTQPSGSPGGAVSHVSQHIIDSAGVSRRLEGLPDAPSLTLLPNGRALTGRTAAGRVYLVPTQAGDALVVGRVSGWAVEQVFDRTLTPPGTSGGRVFLAIGGPTDAIFAIYDSSSHSLREIGRGDWPGGPGAFAHWVGPDEVYVGTDVIDVRTGQRSPVPQGPSSLQGWPAPLSSPSPDGRYTLHTTDPAACRVEIEAADSRRDIGGCSANVLSASWLDNSHAVLRTSTCRGPCDDPGASLELVDAAAGEIVPLTEGTVENASVLVSPDKTRFLVTGNTLTERALDGTERRRFEPPPGFRISDAAWSPDGSSYAYIVSPKGWHLYGP